MVKHQDSTKVISNLIDKVIAKLPANLRAQAETALKQITLVRTPSFVEQTLDLSKLNQLQQRSQHYLDHQTQQAITQLSKQLNSQSSSIKATQSLEGFINASSKRLAVRNQGDAGLFKSVEKLIMDINQQLKLSPSKNPLDTVSPALLSKILSTVKQSQISSSERIQQLVNTGRLQLLKLNSQIGIATSITRSPSTENIATDAQLSQQGTTPSIKYLKDIPTALLQNSYSTKQLSALINQVIKNPSLQQQLSHVANELNASLNDGKTLLSHFQANKIDTLEPSKSTDLQGLLQKFISERVSDPLKRNTLWSKTLPQVKQHHELYQNTVKILQTISKDFPDNQTQSLRLQYLLQALQNGMTKAGNTSNEKLQLPKGEFEQLTNLLPKWQNTITQLKESKTIEALLNQLIQNGKRLLPNSISNMIKQPLGQISIDADIVNQVNRNSDKFLNLKQSIDLVGQITTIAGHIQQGKSVKLEQLNALLNDAAKLIDNKQLQQFVKSIVSNPEPGKASIEENALLPRNISELQNLIESQLRLSLKSIDSVVTRLILQLLSSGPRLSFSQSLQHVNRLITQQTGLNPSSQLTSALLQLSDEGQQQKIQQLLGQLEHSYGKMRSAFSRYPVQFANPQRLEALLLLEQELESLQEQLNKQSESQSTKQLLNQLLGSQQHILFPLFFGEKVGQLWFECQQEQEHNDAESQENVWQINLHFDFTDTERFIVKLRMNKSLKTRIQFICSSEKTLHSIRQLGSYLMNRLEGYDVDISQITHELNPEQIKDTFTRIHQLSVRA